ncbi:MAG TPA: flagellar basal body rod protein FlgC [Luteitalea sp.]|nr:flagellar basal body rod protein FlgC [Luteitalea sp.]
MPTLNTAVSVAASALTAERTRIEVAVSNLANAESTKGLDGKPFRRRDVVLTADPVQSFDNALGRASATGVKVSAIVEDTSPARRKYDPSHPDADGEGYVAMPNINPAEEMVDMVGASRAYQANLTAINLIRDLVSRALELGKV